MTYMNTSDTFATRSAPVRVSSPQTLLKQQRRQSGFTLVEILVVITVIIVLMGLLAPAVMGALKSAREADTTSRMNQIIAGIEMYQTKKGRYPLFTGAVNKAWSGTGSSIIGAYSSNTLSSGSTTPYPNGGTGYNYSDNIADLNRLLRIELSSIDPDAFSEESEFVAQDGDYKGCLIDALGNPFHYLPYTAYVSAQNPKNRNSFQIWSIGEDEVNDVHIHNAAGFAQKPDANGPLLPYGDDLANWSTAAVLTN